MAIQIIPQEGGSARYGRTIGGAAGSGIGGLIEGLVEGKVQRLKKEHDTQVVHQAFRGLPPEVAAYVSTLPPKEQLAFIEGLAEQQRSSAQQQEQQPFSLESVTPQQKELLLEAINQQPEMLGELTEDKIQKLRQFLSPAQQEQPAQELAQQQEQSSPYGQIGELLRRAPGMHGVENKIPGLNSLIEAGKGFVPEEKATSSFQDFPRKGHGTLGQAAPSDAVSSRYEQEPVIPKQKGISISQVGAKAENSRRVAEERKLSVAEQKQLHKERELATKETKKYYDSTLEKAKDARDANTRLNKMERLVNEGGLPIAAFYNLFNRLEESVPPAYGAPIGAGIGTALGAAAGSVVPGVGTAIGAGIGSAIGGGIGALVSPVAGLLKDIQRGTSPNTQEFEKLSNQFIKGAKAVFGARITDNDLKAYMAQIPTLANTDSGKKAIINDMKIANDAELVRERIMRQIIKENKGYRPSDLAEQVEERAKPELDYLAKKFINT